jgi:Fe-S-cluster containining protein
MSGNATISPSTKKELLWLSCREKSCCHTTKVVISGFDMWRINQAMELMPWQYARYVDAPADASDGFLLQSDGPRFQVVLAKRGEVDEGGAPCVFLLKLNDGHAQCGLGQLKPTACQAYPAVLIDGLLRCSSSACTCRRWSVLDLDVGYDIALLQRMLEEAAEYAQIVETWNEEVEKSQQIHTFRDFCAYVVDAYSSLFGDTR